MNKATPKKNVPKTINQSLSPGIASLNKNIYYFITSGYAKYPPTKINPQINNIVPQALNITLDILLQLN